MSKIFHGEKCHNIVKNLREINETAGVDPEVVDLLEAFARLRLSAHRHISFYDPPGTIRSEEIKSFISKNSHLDQRTLNFLSAYFLEMKKRRLKCIFSTRHLSEILAVDQKRLSWLANDRGRHYNTFHIDKRDGTKRKIHSPKPRLRTIQRGILDTVLAHVRLNPHAEGFRKNRSILTNARRHVSKNIIIKLDAKDFFPSITFSRVLGMFTALGYPNNVALMLTGLTTCEGKLPIGAPTSPAILNIIATKLDKRLARLGEKMGFCYSRYADDLTISSDDRTITQLIPFFKQIIQEEGFVVQDKKIRIMRNGGQQKITGIVVNQKMNAERSQIRKLRAVIHNRRFKNIHDEKIKWAKKEKNLQDPSTYTMKAFKASVRGKINFVIATSHIIWPQNLTLLK
ncbi:MAG: reverse transcriptase family protein [Thermodesulfobacteriota bacterium]|nr:reverse transcriptase family protein [Thermodesulfobacteriota bacterium]